MRAIFFRSLHISDATCTTRSVTAVNSTPNIMSPVAASTGLSPLSAGAQISEKRVSSNFQSNIYSRDVFVLVPSIQKLRISYLLHLASFRTGRADGFCRPPLAGAFSSQSVNNQQPAFEGTVVLCVLRSGILRRSSSSTARQRHFETFRGHHSGCTLTCCCCISWQHTIFTSTGFAQFVQVLVLDGSIPFAEGEVCPRDWNDLLLARGLTGSGRRNVRRTTRLFLPGQHCFPGLIPSMKLTTTRNVNANRLEGGANQTKPSTLLTKIVFAKLMNEKLQRQ